MKKFESIVIDFVSGVVPWLSPIVPAFLTFSHALNVMHYPLLIAIVAGVVVECLGLAAINTAVSFWQYNDEKKIRSENALLNLDRKGRDKARRRKQVSAPFKVAVGIGAFYIGVILLFNGLLDVASYNFQLTAIQWATVAGNVMLSLLSLPGGLIIAIRSQHARRMVEAETKRTARMGANGREQYANTYEQYANEARTGANKVTREIFVTQWQANGHKSIAALANELGVNPRTAQKWVKNG
ncbi:hypothetical protein ANRL4_04964 [Anaerolineae bacterium]|nr:hypothetical protein ANRL4_04964 [Anaerolineae bacterium]